MKTRPFFILLIVLTAISCHKQDINNQVKTCLSGAYTGRSEVRSNNLEQVYTTPDESHFEWIADSVFTDPDMLIVNNLSADSFELAGQMAMLLPDYWRHLPCEELQVTDTAFVLLTGLSSPFGYYSESLNLSFSTDGKHASVNYNRSTTNSHLSVMFNG